MRILKVRIEQNHIRRTVGFIIGNTPDDAVFRYDPTWLHSPLSAPVSVHLPLQEDAFSADETRNFFEGLLPEGFTRRSVAQWMQVDENDYLSILSGLGKECLGALQIVDAADPTPELSHYKALDLKSVQALSAEGATRSAEIVVESHLSLTGASGKVGLYYDSGSQKWYQPIGLAPSTHIVKQSHVRLAGIVINEQLVLRTASHLGIRTPESFIINIGNGRDAEILFASRRYDRFFTDSPEYIDGLALPVRLHQEDFSQALGIPSSQKYEKPGHHYLRQIFTLIRQVSAKPLEDQKALLDLLIFNVLIGNTDDHVKNYSLLYSPDLQSVRLAPAYDLLCTLIYPGHSREMSIIIGEENHWDKIGRNTFLAVSGEIGLSRQLIGREYDRLMQELPSALDQATSDLIASGLPGIERIKESIRIAIQRQKEG